MYENKGLVIKNRFKERIRQPIFYIHIFCILISLFACIAFQLVPFGIWFSSKLPIIQPSELTDVHIDFSSKHWYSNETLFIFFSFFLCFLFSIFILLHSLGIVSIRFPKRRLYLFGFIPAFAAAIFTIMLTIDFIRYSINYNWILANGFLISISCSLILMFIFLLQLRSEPLIRRRAVIIT
ncbi:MAG: hypothetical protein FK734_08280 [Asgard group archaeon]|nr:hypothetical protein [Asgard group archaeon]